jgi:hypothetical protein
MGRVLGGLIAGCLLCGAAAAQTLTPQTFTERVVEAMRAAEPSATPAITGELAITVRRANGNSVNVSLANLYGEYRQQPERLAELVAIALEAMHVEKALHERAGKNGKVAPLDPES